MTCWEENVKTVVPYVPGEQPNHPKMIKLNTNENPYPPAPGVQKVLDTFDKDRLRLYPDPLVDKLNTAIAEAYGVDRNQVFTGVGSDDVLAMIFMTFFNSRQPILFPDVTYSFYDVWAELFKIPFTRVPLDENLRINPKDYGILNGGIIFPNPNAPTGEYLPYESVEEIIRRNPSVMVVVDEAYIDFGGESALPLVEKYDNVIVVRTFSKSRSLAGSRVGFAISNAKAIRYLNDVKYSFNSYTMDALTIELATEAVKDKEYFDRTRAKIIETREWTKEQLKSLGFQCGDSRSNFLFVTHESYEAEKLYEALRENHIYVRYFKKPERISNYLRISIGTDWQMESLVAFLKEYMK